MKKRFFCSLALLAIMTASPVCAQQLSVDEQIQLVRDELNATGTRIRAIVNQPVTTLPYSSNTQVGRFSPGWFHEGAIKPDFDTVDIRETQEFPYEKFPYVTSDVTPGQMFIGNELEFNKMTKYFYVNRSLPKHRLSEEQMLEVNRLYRIMGADLRKLDALEHPGLFSNLSFDSPVVTLLLLAIVGGAMAVMYRSWFARR